MGGSPGGPDPEAPVRAGVVAGGGARGAGAGRRARPVSVELERGELDQLALHWRAGWQGAGFEACCTPDVAYEDPVAVDLLRGVESLDRHAAGLRGAFPDLRVESTAPTLVRGVHACIPWRATGTHRGDLGTMLPA